MLQASIPASAIRDTIARIVVERGYERGIGTTLLSRFMDWIGGVVRDLYARATESRGTGILTLTVLGVLLLAALVRALVLARARRRAAAHHTADVTADALAGRARALAAQGLYAEAAHELYAALITRLVERKRARRHASKTIGDYGRDLRARDDALLPSYLAFARVYEVVAYGDGRCDAARFAQLQALAEPLLSDREAVAAPRAA